MKRFEQEEKEAFKRDKPGYFEITKWCLIVMLVLCLIWNIVAAILVKTNVIKYDVSVKCFHRYRRLNYSSILLLNYTVLFNFGDLH